MARLKSVTRSSKLGPEEREAAIARLKEKEHDEDVEQIGRAHV